MSTMRSQDAGQLTVTKHTFGTEHSPRLWNSAFPQAVGDAYTRWTFFKSRLKVKTHLFFPCTTVPPSFSEPIVMSTSSCPVAFLL